MVDGGGDEEMGTMARTEMTGHCFCYLSICVYGVFGGEFEFQVHVSQDRIVFLLT